MDYQGFSRANAKRVLSRMLELSNGAEYTRVKKIRHMLRVNVGDEPLFVYHEYLSNARLPLHRLRRLASRNDTMMLRAPSKTNMTNLEGIRLAVCAFEFGVQFQLQPACLCLVIGLLSHEGANCGINEVLHALPKVTVYFYIHDNSCPLEVRVSWTSVMVPLAYL
ncbi:hypothetical protein VTO42DRAFT_4307 [Malbranchea cinnamomea]